MTKSTRKLGRISLDVDDTIAGVVAVGVATGRSPFDELVGAGADHVLCNLSNVKSAMAIINGTNARIKHKHSSSA